MIFLPQLMSPGIRLFVINATSNQIVANITLGNENSYSAPTIALNPDMRSLYITDPNAKSVYVLNETAISKPEIEKSIATIRTPEFGSLSYIMLSFGIILTISVYSIWSRKYTSTI